jgi:cysteine synthase A
MARILSGIAKTMGNTPLVRLNRMGKGLHGDIIAKLEFFNLLGLIPRRSRR